MNANNVVYFESFGVEHITKEIIKSIIEHINGNKLMSKIHKKVCTTLNYIEHFLILGSTITRIIPISAFASLVGIPIEITSSAIGLKICQTFAAIKK